jgi:hypothetical protein
MYHIKYSCVLTTTYIILLVLNKHKEDNSPQSSCSVLFPHIINLDNEYAVSMNIYLTLQKSMVSSAEEMPCFFLSCKANTRVKPAKTGHGQ